MEFCLPQESKGYEMKLLHSSKYAELNGVEGTKFSSLVLIPRIEYSSTIATTTNSPTLLPPPDNIIIMKRAHSNCTTNSPNPHQNGDDESKILRSSSPTVTLTPTSKSTIPHNKIKTSSTSNKSKMTKSTTTTNDLKCSINANNNNNKYCSISSSSSTSTSSSSSSSTINCSSSICDVFLGGSCNPTTWRTEIAIPMLKNFGISYYNPQVASWCPELMEAEHRAKDRANVLFFVLDNQTRAISATLEVAYLVAQGKNVVLVMNGVGETIMGEPISQSEFEELTCGQLVLQDLVRRHQIPVFTDITSALKCTAKIIHEGVPLHDSCKAKDLVSMNFNNSYANWVTSNLRKIFDSLAGIDRNGISLYDITKAYKSLMNQDLNQDKISQILDNIKKRKVEDCNNEEDGNAESIVNNNTRNYVTYEEFCCLMTELINNQKTLASNSSTSILTTTSKYVHNISGILKKLSEHLPSSKSTIDSNKLSSEKLRNKKEDSLYDVYLGGVACTACAKWREEIAIPTLEKYNISFFNPESIGNNRATNFLPLNSSGIEDCKILFFYLSNASRALEVLTMAAYYIGLKREVVLCVENLSEDCKIGNESMSKLAVKDYNRGRSYISDIASRDGILVHDNLKQAIDALIDKCNSTSL